MISAEETWILKDQPTPTWTDWSLKSFHHWLPLWDSMVLWMWMLLNSRPTWCHIQESTLCFHLTPQSSLLRRPTTNSSLLLKSPTLLSNQHPWWPSATQDTESTWPAAWCTEVMSSPRMSTLLLPPSRPREPSNSSTGAQLASNAESTTSHQLLSQEEIWPKSWEPCAWSPTPPPSLKSSPESITNSI